ncbi:hypothetical protein HGRIS_004407 [Hohenbuehelia grisea]|uniref:Uncharacterized protein n=1 Tax=Hohenbuehelia grisea TaxID=104357 RepID=A0ABR3JBW3_9AGAR
MGTLKQELRGVTYEADWVADHFCRAPTGKVDDVMNSVRKASIWRSSESVAQNLSVMSMKYWPPRESLFSKPLVALLNAIITSFEESFPDDYQRTSRPSSDRSCS